MYFEVIDGIKQNWIFIWKQFIKDTQSESTKLFHGLRHFLRTISKVFKCKPRRKDQDCCNDCNDLHVKQTLATQKTDSAEQRRLQSLQSKHLFRACTAYQLTTHFRQIVDSSSSSQKILIRGGTSFMEHPNTFVHIEIDHDKDHPECVNRLNATYFKRKIRVKTLNVVMHPADPKGGRKIYSWSARVEWNGGWKRSGGNNYVSGALV